MSFIIPGNGGPSPLFRRVGSHTTLFEACSRSLTLRPARSPSRLSDPLHQKLRQFRYLHCRSDCYRLERPVAGWESHPLKFNTFARRTELLGYCRVSLRDKDVGNDKAFMPVKMDRNSISFSSF